VGLEYGWRSDGVGGDAQFTVSLIEVATDTVLGSSNLVVAATGAINNTYTLVGTASLSINYNTNAVTAGSAVALRIERTDADDGLVGDNWQSTAFVDTITVDAVGVTITPPEPPPLPTEVVLLNGNFEDGADNNSASNWTDTGSNAYYLPAEGPYVGNRALSIQDGASAEQDLEVPAYLFPGTWILTFDKGFRDDFFTGTATVTMSLIDAVDSTVFATTNFEVTGTGSPDTASIVFSPESVVFDMAAVSSNNIVLKIENTTGGGGTVWERTALVDNLVLTVENAIGAPATILSLSPGPAGTLRLVIDAPGAQASYWPKARTSLILGDWEGVAHSVDGSDPWQVTNLTYVTEFESGTNEVIYVQASDAAKFFGVGSAQ
ncbi:MAG: hypothetical protein KAU94_06210, partial [Verrucomicrobia bacterium]|nr:hypothetical protein [Verrucomicrobiota bacterium]